MHEDVAHNLMPPLQFPKAAKGGQASERESGDKANKRLHIEFAKRLGCGLWRDQLHANRGIKLKSRQQTDQELQIKKII